MIHLEPVPVLGRTFYYVLPAELPLAEVEALVLSIKSYLLEGAKVRILWDGEIYTDTIHTALKQLQAELENLSFAPTDYTNYFQITRPQIEAFLVEHPEVDWLQTKQSQFAYRRVQAGSEDQNIVENFATKSNCVLFTDVYGRTFITDDADMQATIRQQLPKALEQPKNYIFLVYQTEPFAPVGCFDLAQVNDTEAQLHYTSGLSDLPNRYQGGKRMPILAAAIYDVFLHTPEFAEFQSIAFSSRDQKVVELYQQNGFRLNPERHGIIVKVGMTKKD
jgi:hypothetical protein